MRTFKDANVRSHVQSHKSGHVSGVHCHVCASSTSGCAFAYITVHYCIQSVVQYLYVKPRMSGSEHKSSGDVAAGAKKHQLFYYTLQYFSKYYTVRLKMFYFSCLLCYILSV